MTMTKGGNEIWSEDLSSFSSSLVVDTLPSRNFSQSALKILNDNCCRLDPRRIRAFPAAILKRKVIGVTFVAFLALTCLFGIKECLTTKCPIRTNLGRYD